MLDDALEDGHNIRVLSAFRSFDEQAAVKNQHTFVYGSGANAFSADQGYSEHQLGTTVDIVDTATGATSVSFATTNAYAWLQENAHQYGFVLSYPEGNQFYIFEPWHWRFVGRDLASDLHDDNKTFYDLDQRELDAYLVKIFD
jgi:zinc D-Ala-D-Ala carboxypeptidase